MTQFERTKATILFVEFPDDAESIIYYPRWIMYADSTWNKTKRGKRIELPEGTWQFITLLKDAREDVAMTLVDETNMKEWGKERRIGYRDYSEPLLKLGALEVMNGIFFEALPSLHSLATSLGVKGNAAVLVKVSV